MNAQLSAALDLAKQGFWVFPCAPNKKTPAIKNWPAKATRDEAAIRKWWTGRSYNIGVSTAKFGDNEALLVVDVDSPSHGAGKKDGGKTMLALELDGREFPVTLQNATPTGGRHLVYRVGAAVRQGVDVLGNGLDVRSHGGYIVAPGSVVAAGTYGVERSAPIAPAPHWLIDACGTPRTATTDRTPLPGVDPARALQRGIEYLATAPRSVKGAGGDQCAYAIAAKLLALGMDEPAALDLLLSEHWEHGCGWSADRLAEKVGNAARYMLNAPGSDAPEAQFEPVPENKPARHYNLLSVGDLLNRAPPSWLVRGLLPARGLGVVYGAPGSGKSFLVLDLAAAIARGIPWAGQRVKRGAVVYVGLEGQMGPRVAAYLRDRELKAADVAGLQVIERQGLNLLQDERADVGRLIADIQGADLGPVAMVVVDTLNRAMPGGNENASEDMGRAIRCAGEVSAALDCLCVFVHHSGKDAGKGARGHSSLLGAADAELEVRRGDNGEARFLEATKVKDGEDGARFAFRLKVVDLGATRDHDPDADPSERDASCVVEGLERATVGATGKARNWTAHRTNALEALRTAFDRSRFGAVNWDDEGVCSIDDWRAAYFELVPIGDALEGDELRTARNSRTRNFSNAVDWLTAEKLVRVEKKKSQSGYRIVS
ncbi:AAA family ATPase [Rhodanobacter umsongensis]|uniref:AAA family ATPase n=1 Tax=Rhodanobacter umsongensis TaxID=633153 RepID=A0ABW0JM20_9GAMM